MRVHLILTKLSSHWLRHNLISPMFSTNTDIHQFKLLPVRYFVPRFSMRWFAIAFDGKQKANKFTCTRYTRLWRKWAKIMVIDAIWTVPYWTKSLLDDRNILMRQLLFHTEFKIINLFHFHLTFRVWHRFMIQNWRIRWRWWKQCPRMFEN